mgnify:CR=1 FL=1
MPALIVEAPWAPPRPPELNHPNGPKRGSGMYDSVLGQGGGPAGWYSTNCGLRYKRWYTEYAIPRIEYMENLRLRPKKTMFRTRKKIQKD